MKLYVTPTSPYALLAMIVREEKDLVCQVQLVWTRTRVPNDPMLAFNPSGRIPFLLPDDGPGLEDTGVIVECLDHFAPPLRFAPPTGEPYWPYRRLQASARSMRDGVSVWAREMVRPADERSPTIISHERRRAERLADHFEALTSAAPFTGNLNVVQLLLFCTLNLERRLPDFDWREGHPALVDWHGRMRDQRSIGLALKAVAKET